MTDKEYTCKWKDWGFPVADEMIERFKADVAETVLRQVIHDLKNNGYADLVVEDGEVRISFSLFDIVHTDEYVEVSIPLDGLIHPDDTLEIMPEADRELIYAALDRLIERSRRKTE